LLVLSLASAISLAALIGLPLAAGARAQLADAPESAAEAPVGVTAEGGVSSAQPSPGAEQPPSTTEQAGTGGEQAPPTTEPTPDGEQAPPPAEQTAPTIEQAPPTEQSPATEPTTPAPAETVVATEQAPPPPEAPPSAGGDPPAAEEKTAPAGEQTIAEETPAGERGLDEKQAGKAGAEASSEEPTAEGTGSTHGTGDSQTPTDASEADHKEPTLEVAVPHSAPATTPDALGIATVPVVSSTSSDGQASSARGATTIQPRPRQASELAVCAASPMTVGSADSWMAMPGPSSISAAIALAAIVRPPRSVIVTGALARDRDDSSTIESRDSTPLPNPAPGGAGGGSAAGASSSAASSASSILVSSMLQATPNVMLRLCLSQPSWHTSFFALFPERPG
jgi:hypothetical protein